MDPDTQIRRLEQQLNAFEKLHANELKDFQEKLAAYVRIHADEVRLLREQIDDLKKTTGMQAAQGGPPARASIAGERGERQADQQPHSEEAES